MVAAGGIYLRTRCCSSMRRRYSLDVGILEYIATRRVSFLDAQLHLRSSYTSNDHKSE